MEPFGGELFIDRFCEARRLAAAPKPAAPPAARAASTAPAPARPAAPRAAAPPPAPAPHAPDDGTDTGKLRAEVDAFMQRDAIESTDDVEIQEFLKERAGFNPNDLE